MKNMTISQEFKSVLKSILIEALTEFDHLCSTEKVPLKVVPRLSVDGHGITYRSEETEPDIQLFLLHTRKYIASSPVYQKFCRSVESDPVLGNWVNKYLGTVEGKRILTVYEIFYSFFEHYFEKNHDKTSFDEDLFERIWKDLDNFLTNKKLTIHYQAVLENFDMEIDKIELDSRIVIRRFRPGEVKEMWNENSLFRQCYPFPSLRTFPAGELKGLVEAFVEMEILISDTLQVPEPQISSPYDLIERQFSLTLTLLRLLKPGIVWIGPMMSETSHFFHKSISLIGIPVSRRIPRSKYIIEVSDIEDLKLIWSALNKIDWMKNRALTLGLTRLNFAYERLIPEDKLIDSFIAFEALVLSDLSSSREKEGLRRGLSVRIAQLLGVKYEDQERIKRTIRQGYTLRSNVVHGRKLESTNYEIIEKVFDLCRETARELVTAASKSDET